MRFATEIKGDRERILFAVQISDGRGHASIIVFLITRWSFLSLCPLWLIPI